MGVLKDMKAFAREFWDIGQKMADDRSLLIKMGMSDQAAKMFNVATAPVTALFLAGTGGFAGIVGWQLSATVFSNLVTTHSFMFAVTGAGLFGVGPMLMVGLIAVMDAGMCTKAIKNIATLVSPEKTPATVLSTENAPKAGFDATATSAVAFKKAVDGQKPESTKTPFNPTTPNP